MEQSFRRQNRMGFSGQEVDLTLVQKFIFDQTKLCRQHKEFEFNEPKIRTNFKKGSKSEISVLEN